MVEKKISVKQAINKLAVYCSKAEKCKNDVLKKLHQWEISNYADEIIASLEKDNYLNELRYTNAFVNDKIKIQKWGKAKVVSALRSKNIDREIINTALTDIDENEYSDRIKLLLSKKNSSLKETDIYKRRIKLARFGIQRGYEQELVFKIADRLLKE